MCSRLTDSGHVVLVRLPEGAVFAATFAGDGDPRDITDFVADLLLTGALDAAEQRESGAPAPAEQVEAAQVAYLEAPGAPGQLRSPASFSWAHLPTREAGDFAAEDVVALIVRGMGVEITAAVAAEVEVPTDAAGLAGPEPDGVAPGENP